MKFHWVILSSLMVFLQLGVFSEASKAGPPTDHLRQTADKVLLILQDPRLKSADMREERYDQLRQVISAKFDFPAMAQRSLGPSWQQRTAEERSEFVQLFTDLLERTYADQIAAYNGETISYGRESQDGNYAEVPTKIFTNKGEEFSVHYKLQSADQDWKVYDVVIENISLVNNYRAQFRRVLAKSTFAELLRRMRAKQFHAPQKKAAIDDLKARSWPIDCRLDARLNLGAGNCTDATAALKSHPSIGYERYSLAD